MFDLCLICDVSCISSISIEYDNFYMLWVNRAKKASRATAGLTTDPMSIAMPIPPTFEATLSSFGRGRDLDALAC